MADRRELVSRIVNSDGVTVTVRILDGITIDDIMIQFMKSTAYRVVTGNENIPSIDKNMKDSLIKRNIIIG